MNDDTKGNGMSHGNVTESDLITYTQIASCAVGDCTSKPQRRSLRAKLERELEERKAHQKKSLFSSFRSLFG